MSLASTTSVMVSEAADALTTANVMLGERPTCDVRTPWIA